MVLVGPNQEEAEDGAWDWAEEKRGMEKVGSEKFRCPDKLRWLLIIVGWFFCFCIGSGVFGSLLLVGFYWFVLRV